MSWIRIYAEISYHNSNNYQQPLTLHKSLISLFSTQTPVFRFIVISQVVDAHNHELFMHNWLKK